MLKVLLAFLSLFTFRAIAQYGTIDEQISANMDPEVFFVQKDSLNAIDTTKAGINFREYCSMQYSLDLGLYRFDRKKEHLTNCIIWSGIQYSHYPDDVESLIRAIEVCKKLNDKLLGQKYYDLVLKTEEKEWSPDQKRRIDDTVLWLSHEDIVDIEYSIEESSCEMDTLAEIHSNAAIYFDEQKEDIHELVSGENNFLQLKINTKACRCSDCSYSTTIFIQLPTEKLPVSMNLNSTNCFYSNVNTWIYEPKETISFGKFCRNETGLYLILAYKNSPADDLYLLQTYWISSDKIKELN